MCSRNSILILKLMTVFFLMTVTFILFGQKIPSNAYSHSIYIYIRAVSSQRMLTALLNQSHIVYRPYGQSNMQIRMVSAQQIIQEENKWSTQGRSQSGLDFPNPYTRGYLLTIQKALLLTIGLVWQKSVPASLPLHNRS